MKICRAIQIFAAVMTLFAGLPAVAQTFSTLYSFAGTPDGANPFQSDLLKVNGTWYGTTGTGGTFGAGTIFTLSSTDKETPIYSFTGGADGNEPSSGLIRDGKGNFYGTTLFGGDTNCPINLGNAPGCGTVYKLDSSHNLSVLYTFTGSTDGAWPQGLVMDSAGNLYGVTFYGGNLNCPLLVGIGCGVVFKISSTGAFSTLYTFQGATDGGIPVGFLTLHGTAVYGGTQAGGTLADCGGVGCGVIFQISTSTFAEKPLYAFTGGADGGLPTSQFLFDSKNNLYGTTYAGGDLSCSNQNSLGCGVIFRLTPAGRESAVYAFKGSPDAANPSWGLTLDSSGNGWGTTIYGGTSNVGAVFKITSKGVESVQYSFTGTRDGAYPQSGLVRIGNSFYSNTVKGGILSCNSPSGCGTIFEFTP